MKTTDELSLEVRWSGVWQMSSTLLSRGGTCLMVDPGYFPRELDELSLIAGQRGEVEAVVFTHGHWDHVVGWQAFPRAAVWASPGLSRAIAEGGAAAQKDLDDARDFDARYYVERPFTLRWPDAIRPLQDGERIAAGALTLEALLLPGHSPDGLALLVPQRGLLIAGDYLSSCEIPFVDDLHAYRRTLQRLQQLLPGLAEVIPGHGPRLSSAEAQRIAEADLHYLDQLALLAERGDAAAALSLPLPRAAAVPGMRAHHQDNCRKAEAAALASA